MGNTTDVLGMWSPDDANNVELDVALAAMMQAVEDAFLPRILKQEKRVSLRATTPVPFDVVSASPGVPYVMVPLAGGNTAGLRPVEPDYSAGNHADGLTLAGNTVTIVTDGMYSISAQITTRPGTHDPHSWDFYGSVNGVIFGLPTYGSTDPIAFTAGGISDTRYLVEGDEVKLFAGVGTDHIGGFQVQDVLLQIAMLYAT